MLLQQRNTLVEQNVGLVRKVAHNYSTKCPEPYADLEQVGYLGLIRAIERFDPTRGNKFSTYAMPFIRGEILHYLRDKGNLIKIPRTWQEKFQSINRAALKSGETLAECAARLGMDTHEWQSIARAMVSTPMTLLEEGLDCDFKGKSEQGYSSSHDEYGELYASMRSLSSDEKKVVQLCYFDNLSHRQAARTLGWKIVRVSEVLNRALQQMKAEVVVQEAEGRNVIQDSLLLPPAPCPLPLLRGCQLSVGNSTYPAVKNCPHCGCSSTHLHGRSRGNQRYFCPKCDRTFVKTAGTVHYRRRITRPLIDQILRQRQSGASLKSLHRTTGVAYNTIKSIIRVETSLQTIISTYV